jgi:hypothetical protein
MAPLSAAATTPSGFTAAAIGGILGAWLCSPAAAILMPDKRAGSSTTATCTSARSGCDPASPMTRCRGAGAAASIYPGSEPGECTSGTAATFDQARAAFESAWRLFRSKRPEADPGLARSARLDGGEILALRPRRARAAGLAGSRLRRIEPFSARPDLQALCSPKLLAVGGKLLAAPSFEI